MTLAAKIFAHALASPDKVAAVQNGRPISYRRLAANISLARRFFVRRGDWPGQVAVLCVTNVLAGWILRLGLQSLGATTVIVRAAEDIAPLGIGPAVIVSDPGEAQAWGGLGPTAAAGGHQLLTLAPGMFADWRDVDLSRDAPAMASAAGAHVLLTSGTTGVYKKVRHDAASQAGVVALNSELAAIDADTVFSLFNFPGWTGVNYIWPTMTWHAGGQVVFHQGPDRWRPLIDAELTHAVVTPQMLMELMDAAPQHIPSRSPRLRLFVTGGVLSEDQWRLARERLSADLWSLYGATETANVTFTPLERPDDLYTQRIHSSESVQVVDDQGRPTSAGHIGRVRLKVTGPAEYLDDPVATAAFFQDGYFYPGDLGMLREDGRLVLQGRMTDVINVLGAKIATLPIETMLQDRCGLAAACVFSAPGPQGETVHVAVQSARPIDQAAIRAALASVLPQAVPLHIHPVDSMPRNTMGKIERARLKASLAR